MTHIICAKGSYDYNGGDGKHSGGTPDTQTEAATELIIQRLKLISMVNTNEINPNDVTIVTLPERKFLYENIFNNVIDYVDGHNYDGVDLVIQNTHLAKTLPYRPFYCDYERDKELIHNVKYNDEILNMEMDDFLVCIPRLKNSDTRRNLDKQYWIDFINLSKNKFSKIIVFGKGNEDLNGGNVVYVDTLQDYCSYIHHKNCKHVVSSISGPCHYVQQFGNVSNKTTLTMIDNLDMISENKEARDPSYFNPCINFTNVQVNIIKGMPSVEELGERIWPKWWE